MCCTGLRVAVEPFPAITISVPHAVYFVNAAETKQDGYRGVILSMQNNVVATTDVNVSKLLSIAAYERDGMLQTEANE